MLSLEELHYIVKDVWLTRHDQEIEVEKASRRKGRPKSAKEMKLEEQKLREVELYRTGMGECSPHTNMATSQRNLIPAQRSSTSHIPPTLSSSASGTKKRQRTSNNYASFGYQALPQRRPSSREYQVRDARLS